MTFNEWIQNRWRPITAIVYLIICVFDFMIFPVMWSLFLHLTASPDLSIAWDPLTLKGAGMFHLSFGAILGVSAYTRGQEKVQMARYRETRYDEPEEYDDPEPRARPRFEPPRR